MARTVAGTSLSSESVTNVYGIFKGKRKERSDLEQISYENTMIFTERKPNSTALHSMSERK